MKRINDIQKLIEERAERKFNTDYFNAVKPFMDSQLFKDITILCTRPNGQKTEEYQNWVFREGYGYYEQVKSKWLPIYIEKEAKEFIEQVDQLQQDVQDLLSSNQEY